MSTKQTSVRDFLLCFGEQLEVKNNIGAVMFQPPPLESMSFEGSGSNMSEG